MEGEEHGVQPAEVVSAVSSAEVAADAVGASAAPEAGASSSAAGSAASSAALPGMALAAPAVEPTPFLRGKITAGDSGVTQQLMIWSGEWAMAETDKVSPA